MPGQQPEEVQDSLNELETLCFSAGGEVIASIVQSLDHIQSGYVFGKGKLGEIKELCIERDAQLIIFDGELTPSQQEKLEDYLDTAVIDRPALILDIFARHARSREAKTQVELAQLEYLYPRLAGHWTHLERQESAIGTRGPGETQLESDRRMVQKKISELKKYLAKIDRSRDNQRKKRKNYVRFCLVGYTNAGKSSIFNKLTGDNTLVANRLFATLDSTTRRLELDSKSVLLLSDTVGFIKKLPVDLVESFKSTLKEAVNADLLIHVVDFSASDIDRKINTVNRILADIGAGEIERLLVFNKIDLANNSDLYPLMLNKYPGCRFASAKTGEGIEPLKESFDSFCKGMFREIEVEINQNDSKTVSRISRFLQIYSGNLKNGNLVFRGKILAIDVPKLEKLGIGIEIIN